MSKTVLENMDFDYDSALTVLGDARSKRSKISLSKRFFDTLRKVNGSLPPSSFNTNLDIVIPHASLRDDSCSNELLRQHVSQDFLQLQGRVAKCATGNGNCLFNSVSVALIGK